MTPYLKNRPHYDALSKLWAQKNPDKVKKYYSNKNWRVLGITNSDGTPFRYPDYEKLLEARGRQCAACLTPESSLKSKLYADHDHSTRKIRGLLCQGCNTALGHVKDSLAVLEQLKNYLARSK